EPRVRTRAAAGRWRRSVGPPARWRRASPAARRCRGRANSPRTAGTSRASAADVEQFDLEHQRGAWRDHLARAALAVAQPGRDVQLAPAAGPHAGHAFVPAADDPAGAEPEHEGLATIARAVEPGPAPVGRVLVVQPAGVVDADLVAGGGRVAFALDDVDALQFGHVASGIGGRPAAGGDQQRGGGEGGEAELADRHAGPWPGEEAGRIAGLGARGEGRGAMAPAPDPGIGQSPSFSRRVVPDSCRYPHRNGFDAAATRDAPGRVRARLS